MVSGNLELDMSTAPAVCLAAKLASICSAVSGDARMAHSTNPGRRVRIWWPGISRVLAPAGKTRRHAAARRSLHGHGEAVFPEYPSDAQWRITILCRLISRRWSVRSRSPSSKLIKLPRRSTRGRGPALSPDLSKARATKEDAEFAGCARLRTLLPRCKGVSRRFTHLEDSSAVGSYLRRGRGPERRSSRTFAKYPVGRRNCRDF